MALVPFAVTEVAGANPPFVAGVTVKTYVFPVVSAFSTARRSVAGTVVAVSPVATR